MLGAKQKRRHRRTDTVQLCVKETSRTDKSINTEYRTVVAMAGVGRDGCPT